MVRYAELRELSDEDLARRAGERPDEPASRAAAAELLGRHRERVYRWCRRYVRDHERALDLAQDVMLNAYRALGSFEGRAPFGAWLFTIVRHGCIRAMRPTSLVRDDAVDLDAVVDTRPEPAELLEEKLEEEALMELIRDHLDVDERRALWLRCMDRMPVDEITAMMGLQAASGARGVLQTARRKLRAALERRSMVRAAGQ